MEPSEAGQAIAGDRAGGNALAVDAARSSLQRARFPRGWIAIAGLLVDFLVSIKISSLVYGVLLLPAVFRLEPRDSARHMKPADEGPVDAQAAGGAADSRARGSDACGDIRWDGHQG